MLPSGTQRTSALAPFQLPLDQGQAGAQGFGQLNGQKGADHFLALSFQLLAVSGASYAPIPSWLDALPPET